MHFITHVSHALVLYLKEMCEKYLNHQSMFQALQKYELKRNEVNSIILMNCPTKQ